jgi:DNA modification methylase
MTELIWDDKYIDGKRQAPVRMALPFQNIETVNESAADRNRTLELFASGRPTEWRNRLIWGDKKYVLPSLLPEFSGCVDLIYMDPPFDTGADFSFTATVPHHPVSHPGDGYAFTKEPSIIEQKAYRDTWGRGLDSYLLWFYDTVALLSELLSETGTIYIHLDWHVSHYAKAILDEVFGRERFRNEIVWKRTSAHANVGQRFAMVNDRIFLYSKGEKWTWNQPYIPYSADYLKSHYGQVDARNGKRYTTRDLTASMERASSGQLYSWKGFRPPSSRCWAYTKENMEKFESEELLVYSDKGMPRLKLYLDDMPGTPADDVWTDIFPINSQAEERVGYATQKPEALLERIIKTSSKPKGLVFDPFLGSGTTAAVAERLDRRWIACDLGRFAIHTARKRLLSMSSVSPFAVQNLGKYERQVWQTAEFGGESGDKLQQQQEREKAYRKFILDLYNATPVTGHVWLHGVKSSRMVHVGAVDAPVTLSDIRSVAREVWKASNGSGEGRKAAADILGWEFAFELNETARQIAAESRVDVTFKKIPREVLEKKAVEQGDIKFFELGALSVGSSLKKRELTIELTDFVIPTDDVPEDARKSIKHWSQMIDYWAVDWDFKDDTFHNQWQSYRTRQDPKLELKANYGYSESGEYKVMVKVIDILGNDTTKTLDIKVK